MSGFEKERIVKGVLEKQFQKSFTKQKVLIGEYSREIDLLSSDGKIFVQVKSGRDFADSGRISAYRFAEICVDCLILMATDAERKILVLTDAKMYEQFKIESKGLPLSGIEMVLIEC